MKRIPRRIFREEFKREAIKLVNEQGLTVLLQIGFWTSPPVQNVVGSECAKPNLMWPTFPGFPICNGTHDC